MTSCIENEKNSEIDERKKIQSHQNNPRNALTYGIGHENITELNVCNSFLFEVTSLPTELKHLNLSGNKFLEVPESVTKLRNLEYLNISHNSINSFNKPPAFYHTLIHLDMSFNKLETPPCWIWTKSPESLKILNLNENKLITSSLPCEDLIKLLETSVTDIEFKNCKLKRKHTDFFISFPKLKKLILGSEKYDNLIQNDIEEFPFGAFKNFTDLEILNLANTLVYEIKIDIKNFRNLKEIDLSQNYLNSLPEEFCELFNLEICDLSMNNMQYLPEQISKLKNLKIFIVYHNKLCLVEEDLCTLPLRRLDLYNNELYDVPLELYNIEEIDVALNYLLEPDNVDYIERRNKVRLDSNWRSNGSKTNEYDSQEHSPCLSEDESYQSQPIPENFEDSISDWESDDYWVPHFTRSCTPIPTETRFNCYVKKKMEEGNFCPSDLHTIPIAEMIKYRKMLNPSPFYESDGQFDDYSSDES